MAQEGFRIERVPCIVSEGASPRGPFGGKRGEVYRSAVCDMELLDDAFSMKLNPAWVAKYQEAGKNSAYPRMYRKILESLTKKLDGISVAYAQVEKVSGWKPGKWEEFLLGGAAAVSFGGGLLRMDPDKDGSPFLYQLLVEFNIGGRFWNKTYVEFALTAGEYAMIRGFFISKQVLAGRLELASD